jgi:hypothetical protein
LLDDNLWMNFTLGKISAEEAIDKSRNPGAMVDKMQRNGFMTDKDEEFPEAGDESGDGASPKPGAPAGGGGAAQSEAERQAQIAANRARMQAAAAKK